MARITVEDALEKVSTRYELIILAAKRARQLATGGRRPTLEWEDDKPTVMALREIEAGTVSVDNINDLKVDIADLEQEFSEELSAEDLPLFAGLLNDLWASLENLSADPGSLGSGVLDYLVFCCLLTVVRLWGRGPQISRANIQPHLR